MLMIIDNSGGVKEQHISKPGHGVAWLTQNNQCSFPVFNRSREQNRDESNQKYRKYSFITMDSGNVSENEFRLLKKLATSESSVDE